MNKIKDFEDIKLLEKNGWSNYRKEEDYNLVETYIDSISTNRKIYYVKQKDEKYEMLQCSRGITVEAGHNNQKQLENDIRENQLITDYRDKVRIDELDLIFEKLNIDKTKLNNFCEIGFRIPRLLNYYSNNGYKNAIGYDVVKINVDVANNLGYNAYRQDLNDIENCELSELVNSDLVVSYHMLEHVSRPDLAIAKIHDHMKNGAYFHVEVPIEPDGPRLRYGHLFPFHPHDLHEMLKAAGFTIITASNATHEGGPWIERYFCRK